MQMVKVLNTANHQGKANQNHNEISIHTYQSGHHQKEHRGMVWGGRREEGSGWGTHVYLWRIHFDIWQN